MSPRRIDRPPLPPSSGGRPRTPRRGPSVLVGDEVDLAGAADRAEPVPGDVLERGARREPAVPAPREAGTAPAESFWSVSDWSPVDWTGLTSKTLAVPVLAGQAAARPMGHVFDWSHELNLEVDEATLAERRARWTPPAPRYTTGVLAKYAALVSSASEGAITNGAQLRRTLAGRTGNTD